VKGLIGRTEGQAAIQSAENTWLRKRDDKKALRVMWLEQVMKGLLTMQIEKGGNKNFSNLWIYYPSIIREKTKITKHPHNFNH
jgi:hypothetical protein